jgi:RHS repeat-associated protein
LSTTFSYDVDRALVAVGFPDSRTHQATYDSAGRVVSTITSRGTFTIGYDAASRVSTLFTPEGQGLTFSYDGALRTTEVYSGVVAGALARVFDNWFRVSSDSVNGVAVPYGYDADGLLTQAGGLSITRDVASSRVSGTTLGAVTTARLYSNFGELASLTASTVGAVYGETLHRDLSGQIIGKTETALGETHDYTYAYDGAARLVGVLRDGVPQQSLSYDANGNRLTSVTQTRTDYATYDDQDRMTAYGNATYTYGAGGDLQSRSAGGTTTYYSYDTSGNLLTVVLPDGRRIDYVADPLDRRVAKMVNGALVEGFLYDGRLRPVAWLNGAGVVRARFVYAAHANVPEYMSTAVGTYQIITDHLGSPRLVLDAATGAVLQQLEYDAWGNVLTDSNPGFQPFGFAGGLFDRDTGLVRFGARDYSPDTGRWTSADPVRFLGGPNLFEYAANNPANLVDPTGHAEQCTMDWPESRTNRYITVDGRQLTPPSDWQEVTYCDGSTCSVRYEPPLEQSISMRAYGILYRYTTWWINWLWPTNPEDRRSPTVFDGVRS